MPELFDAPPTTPSYALPDEHEIVAGGHRTGSVVDLVSPGSAAAHTTVETVNRLPDGDVGTWSEIVRRSFMEPGVDLHRGVNLHPGFGAAALAAGSPSLGGRGLWPSTQVAPEHVRLLYPGYDPWTAGLFRGGFILSGRLGLALTSSRARLDHALSGTPSLLERSLTQPASTITRVFMPARVQSQADPPAYRAFKELGGWLRAEDALIADMVGIGRTTPYTWKRDGREPRASTTRKLYEHHATLDAVRRRLGDSVFRSWLHNGAIGRRDTLLAGALSELEPDVHNLLFRPAPGDRPDLSAAPEPVKLGVESSPTPTPRPRQASRRRPRRRSAG